MLTTQSLILVCALGLASGPAPAYFGPPTICFPIEIGNARSLPFGQDAFEIEKSYPLEKLVDDTVRILDRSPDALVHMETLRRAVVYLFEAKRVAKKGLDAKELRANLLDRLRQRLLDMEASGRKERRGRSLRWMDLSFLMAAYHFTGSRVPGKLDAYLARAAELDPKDSALQFGMLMCRYARRGARDWKPAMQRILELEKDEDSLVMRNARAFALHFLGLKKGQSLRERYAQR